MGSFLPVGLLAPHNVHSPKGCDWTALVLAFLFLVFFIAEFYFAESLLDQFNHPISVYDAKTAVPRFHFEKTSWRNKILNLVDDNLC
jgi:hypothetical protein